MEIQVLRNFLAVAREGNITNSANRIHIAQPSLSRQIKNLETELGQQLFVRGSHSVSLTPEGMILRKRAEDVIAMVDKIEDEFYTMGNFVSGDIHIGAGETYVFRYIVDVLKNLQKDYPNIHFHLYSGNAAEVTERLDKGLLDFGLLMQPADIAKYDYFNLPEKDIWGVVMRRDSPLAEKERILCRDLEGLPLICSRQSIQAMEGNTFVKWFDGKLEQMNIIATFSLVYNAALMVQQGLGYMITVDNLVNTAVNPDLCFRPLSPELEAGLAIVWKKYQYFSSAADLFLERLRKLDNIP
ncbi:MAG: LysR family transcriptional regulator [Acetatifactor sp.]